MLRFLAAFMAFISSFLLTTLLFVNTVENRLLEPQFYSQKIKELKIADMLLEQSQKMMVDNIGKQAKGLVPAKDVELIFQKMFTSEWAEKELEKLPQEIIPWLKSNEPVSKLDFSISLAEPKQNLIKQAKNIPLLAGLGANSNMLAAQFPDKIQLSDLGPQAEGVKSQLNAVRGYYQVFKMIRSIAWGVFAVLIIFIALLLINMPRSIFRCLGKLAWGSASEILILSTALIFALKTVVPAMFQQGDASSPAQMFLPLGIDMVSGIMGDWRMWFFILAAIGAVLYLISFAFGRKKDDAYLNVNNNVVGPSA